jgi:hypothetical protein
MDVVWIAALAGLWALLVAGAWTLEKLPPHSTVKHSSIGAAEAGGAS